MRRRAISFVATALLFGLSTPARAGLVVSYQNLTPIIAGSNATLDVMVAAQGDVNINMYGVTFAIERISGSGELTFVNPQDLSYRTETANYLFGNAFEPAPETFGTPSGGVANQQYTTGAVNNLGSGFDDVTLLAGSTYLLARLQLRADDLAAVGSEFRITISSFYESGDGSSEFIAPSDPIKLTVVQPVPEPSTIVSAAAGIIFTCCWGRFRRRRTSASPPR